MKGSAFALAFAALAVAVAVVAARDAGWFSSGGRFAALQREEAAGEVFEKALGAQLEGRVQEAHQLYSDLVVAQPLNAMARLQLAILLQDSAGDPAGAIGQFEAYLALAPGSDKEEMVRGRLQLARDQVARRFGAIERHGASDADVERVLDELARTREALEKAEAAREEALARRDRAVEEVSKLQRTVSSLQRQIDVLQGGAAAPQPRAPERVSAGGDSPRTYRVRRGDTLLGIAQRVYGDATRNRDIREANPGVVGDGDSIREGDVLVLP